MLEPIGAVLIGRNQKNEYLQPEATGRRIIVVEDEMLIAMLLEDMLADLGHQVVAVVPRVNDALVAVEKETFDFAILDVHLSGQPVFPVADASDLARHSVRVRDRIW